MTYLKPLFLIALLAGCNSETRLQRSLDKLDAHGAHLIVHRGDGTRWAGSSGEAVPGTPIDSDHVFFVGSITKMMTATAVLQLSDEGRLDLDDPVSTWVEGVDESITVRHVLQHRTGLGEYFEHGNLDAEQGGTTDQAWTPAELVAMGTEVRNDGPQETATYSNTNYIIAGMMLEEVEQAPLEEVLDARIFEPLGMDDSGLQVGGTAFPDDLAWGHGGTLSTPTRFDVSIGWAAGGAYATSADIDRFLEAVVTGELLEDSTHEAQFEAVDADLGFTKKGIHTAYGLGVMVVTLNGTEVVGHIGNLDGYSSASLADRETGVRATLLSNGDSVDAPGFTVKALRLGR